MVIQRACDHCGKSYEAKRTTSRFCCSGCRRTAGKRRAGQVVDLPSGSAGVVGATETQLQTMGMIGSPLAASALVLAQRIDRAAESPESGSSLASMVKELRMTLVEVAKDRKIEADPIDELRAKRERRLRGVG